MNKIPKAMLQLLRFAGAVVPRFNAGVRVLFKDDAV